MRSGLWAIAFVMSACPDMGLTKEGTATIFVVAFVFLILDIVEYIKKL
jgi:hypothetical protein